MQEYFKVVNKKYNELLLQRSDEEINIALTLINIKKNLLTDNTHIEDGFLMGYLEKKAHGIIKLKEEYKKELKKVLIENNGLLSHITEVSPENLKEGKLLRSFDQFNNYMTEIGDWLFASSSLVDGNNAYIARKPKDGMININYTTIVYGGDNFKIIENEKGENRILLKKPNYIYYLNPEKFEPVCTIIHDRRTRLPRFDFSEEWIYGNDIDIEDKSMVKKIEIVDDVTSLFEWRQIFCEPNIRNERNPAAFRIRSKKPEDRLRIIAEYVKSGRLKYVNKEANINVNEELVKLLDAEARTQEEYEAKKKEILG